MEVDVASVQMRAVALHVRLTRKKRYATERAGVAFLHSAKGPSAPPRQVLAACEVTTRQVRGRDVHVVRPRAPGAGGGAGAVVYLHGGAYTNEIVGQQWAFVVDLARRTGCEVHVPIYGLAPRHTAGEALQLVAAVVEGIVAGGRRCVLSGDSAGGGLALVAAQQAAPGVRDRVAGLLLIAPWVDLSMTNPEIGAVEPTDPWLTRAGLHPIARSWAGDLGVDDPRVSPLHGPMGGLPPVEVWVGTRDITLPDCRELGRRMPPEVPFTLHVEEGAVHDYPLLPAPEGRRARREITARVNTLLAQRVSPRPHRCEPATVTVDELLGSCDTVLDGYAGACRALGDDLVNARLDDVPGTNTAYGLVAHVVGVMARWGRTVNRGILVPRDRDAEFHATGTVAEALALLEAGRARLHEDARAASPREAPANPPPPQDEDDDLAATQGGILLHVHEELAQHLGQLEVTRDVLLARRDGPRARTP